MASHIVVDSNKCFEWGDVTGECDAGSPGSGGASPYLRRDLPVPRRDSRIQPGVSTLSPLLVNL
jgi:hypothetical protein